MHRDELVNQAVEKLRLAGFKDNEIGIEKSTNYTQENVMVVVASLQSIYKEPENINSRLNKLLKKLPRLSLLIYDECHHARAANTYEMLMYLKFIRPQIRYLGVSATPFRADTLELDDIFGDPDETWVIIPREELEALGRLVKLRHTYLAVIRDTDISSLPVVRGDFDISALEHLVNIDNINQAIVEAVFERRDVPGVVYACTVSHARILQQLITQRDITCRLIEGNTPEEERKEIIKILVMKLSVS